MKTFAALVLLAALPTAALAQVSYRIVEYPYSGPPHDTTTSTNAAAINSKGHAAVSLGSSNGSIGQRCSKSACDYIPPLYIDHWPAAGARGINDAGHVVGHSFSQSMRTHAYLWDGAQSTEISGLPDDGCDGCSNDSYAHGINNLEQVVGRAHGSGGKQRGFVWKDKVMLELGTFGGLYSEALGINDHGDVVGNATTAGGATHAFLYRNGKMRDLKTLGGKKSTANAINDMQQVVGCSTLEGDTESRAFLYQAGTMTPLATLGGDYACAHAINANGKVVGHANLVPNSIAYHAFLFDGASVVDLNDTLDASDAATWEITRADGINKKGQIAATGVNRLDTTVRALLLVPRTASASAARTATFLHVADDPIAWPAQ